ncbi:MAG: T9SS type A sorting domain-containing protein, partial [Nonlabens sp.]|nr:T9SS type A sorting domain-containing protein [Nonlabens sp.]
AIAKPTGQLLSVESRTLPAVNESIVLSTTNYATTAYTYVATLDVLPGIVVFLKDNFTGTMTPLAQGTSTAVDFTVDMNNAASIDGSRFELVFNTTTLSNNDVAFGANLSVYPNPVKGDAITVNFGDSTVSNASVLIYNTLGQQVLSSTYNNISGGMIQVGNISGLTNGVYLMNISSNGSTITRRFIKK